MYPPADKGAGVHFDNGQWTLNAIKILELTQARVRQKGEDQYPKRSSWLHSRSLFVDLTVIVSLLDYDFTDKVFFTDFNEVPASRHYVSLFARMTGPFDPRERYQSVCS